MFSYSLRTLLSSFMSSMSTEESSPHWRLKAPYSMVLSMLERVLINFGSKTVLNSKDSNKETVSSLEYISKESSDYTLPNKAETLVCISLKDYNLSSISIEAWFFENLLVILWLWTQTSMAKFKNSRLFFTAFITRLKLIFSFTLCYLTLCSTLWMLPSIAVISSSRNLASSGSLSGFSEAC